MILALKIVTLYSTFDGIKAVAITDVFQFLIFFIALPLHESAKTKLKDTQILLILFLTLI